MEQNLFEELQAKKQHLVTIAKKATEYGWITLDRQKEIVEKYNGTIKATSKDGFISFIVRLS